MCANENDEPISKTESIPPCESFIDAVPIAVPVAIEPLRVIQSTAWIKSVCCPVYVRTGVKESYYQSDKVNVDILLLCHKCQHALISQGIKKEILARLAANNINEKSIYPDEADIETNQYIEQLKTELYNLPNHLEQANKLHIEGGNKININKQLAVRLLKKSIEECNKAIEINPKYHTPHTLKAEILLRLYEVTGEKSHAKKSLENCNISIKLNPKGENPLSHNPRFKKSIVALDKKGIAKELLG